MVRMTSPVSYELIANGCTSSFIPFRASSGMLNAVGKKMLCVYGFKPNHSTEPTSEELSWNSGESMSENFLGDSRKKVTVRIRLFPRESQPSSSTRWWTVTLKAKSVFRRNKHNVKITENVGTKTFWTNLGKFSFDGDNVIVRGQLEDDSIAGRYFVLRLKPAEREEAASDGDVSYEGTLARSRDSCGNEDSWEITHDAVLFRDQTIEA